MGLYKGPILEAMKLLKREGINVNCFQVLYVSPFPVEDVKGILKSAKLPVVVENNKTSLLSGIIRENTGYEIENKVLKYD